MHGTDTSLELDETDYRLLLALQKDSRLPIKDLAKTANVSVPTVRSRLKRLLDLEILKFTAAIDSQKIVGGVSAYVTLRARLPDVKGIARAFMAFEEVNAVHQTTGEYDLVARVSVPDMRAFGDFLTRKLSQLPGVEYLKSNIIVETYKDQYGFTLRPGFGVRLYCRVCKKQIEGSVVKRTLNGHDFFFCCQTCASTFQREREKIPGAPTSVT